DAAQVSTGRPLLTAAVSAGCEGAVVSGAAAIVQVKLCETLNAPSLAMTVTLNVPAVVGVPVIVRGALLMVSPFGRPLAVNVNALPSGSLAVSARFTATPTVPVRLPGLASTGGLLGGAAMVQVKLCDTLNGPLLAFTVTLNVPAVVGVPVMVRAALLIASPFGSPPAVSVSG